jgi:hypothetical protein
LTSFSGIGITVGQSRELDMDQEILTTLTAVATKRRKLTPQQWMDRLTAGSPQVIKRERKSIPKYIPYRALTVLLWQRHYTLFVNDTHIVAVKGPHMMISRETS